jgi:hypothetical protein
MGPKGSPIPRQTGRLTVGLKTNSNSSNYRPVLSSERALQNNKAATVERKFQREIKIGYRSQMGA